MKERVGDEKLIIISVAVRGINDQIRFYSQMLCTAAINTSNTTRTQTGAGRTPLSGTCHVSMYSKYFGKPQGFFGYNFPEPKSIWSNLGL